MNKFLWIFAACLWILSNQNLSAQDFPKCDLPSGVRWTIFSEPSNDPEIIAKNQQDELAAFLPELAICEKNCENGDPQSCNMIGNAYRLGPELWLKEKAEGDTTGVILHYKLLDLSKKRAA